MRALWLKGAVLDNMSPPPTTSEQESDRNPPKDDVAQNPPAASTSFFDRLPIELFEEIIIKVLSDPPVSTTVYYRQMMPLRLVSPFWARFIDYGAPGLWSTTSSELRPQLVELALQRSQQVPLTIRCGKGTSTPWGPDESVYQDLVAPHSHRWRDLRAEGTVKGKPLGVALQPLLGLPLPQLEGLHVCINGWVIPDAGESDEYPHTIHAPLLRDVVLVNCAVPSESLVSLSGLRHLRMGTLHPGRFNPHYFSPTISLSTLFAIFESSPSLVSFSLFGYNAVVDSPSLVHRLTADRLEVLRLNRVAASFILNVLKLLDTPSLKGLEVEPSTGPSATDNQEELLAVVGSRMAAANHTESSTPLLRIKATAWEIKIGHGSSVFTGKRAWDSGNIDLLLFRPLMENLVSGTSAKPLTSLQIPIYDSITIRPTLTLVNEFLGKSVQKLAFLWFNILTAQDIDYIVQCMTAGVTTNDPNNPCFFPNATSLEFHVLRYIGRGPSLDSPGFADRVVEIARLRAGGIVYPIDQVIIPFGTISPRQLEELQLLVPRVEASTGFSEVRTIIKGAQHQN
ncbi:hypothetical protein FRC00_009058 [Tulasnella sp. 408]|nr:hypothetical protein FRC00_009058 [Tulasnella sp. 408]